MLVKTSQLVSGCILTKDVIGKTNRPLIYKKTVLTEELIEILRKFLIPTVRVAKNLENGEVFKPVTVQGKQIKQQRSFIEHYLEVVQKYKKLFDHWQHNMHIHMPYVRKLIIPLLERIDGIGIDVFRLHHYSSKEDYFFHHSISVAIISAFLAKKLGYEKGEWLQVGLAGFLSDCGMAKMSMPIINKFHSL